MHQLQMTKYNSQVFKFRYVATSHKRTARFHQERNRICRFLLVLSIDHPKHLAGEPVEVESLGKSSIDGILSNEARSLLVGGVADLDSAVDVEDGVLSAWAIGGGGDIECITVGVFIASDWAGQSTMSGGLLDLSLEVVESILRSGDFVVEFVEATVVNSCDGEREASWDVDSEGSLAILPVGGNADSGSSFSTELTEGDGDGLSVSTEEVKCRTGRAAGTVNAKRSDIEERGSGGGGARCQCGSCTGVVPGGGWQYGATTHGTDDLRKSNNRGDKSDE